MGMKVQSATNIKTGHKKTFKKKEVLRLQSKNCSHCKSCSWHRGLEQHWGKYWVFWSSCHSKMFGWQAQLEVWREINNV